MQALVMNNVVVDVCETAFDVADPLVWVDCPSDTERGWPVSGGQVVRPQPPIVSVEDARAERKAELATIRYEKENGGFTFMGHGIYSDDRAKTLILGARIEAAEALAANSSFSLYWKTQAGYLMLEAQDVIDMAAALRSHTQACFDNERDHTIGIHSLTDVSEIQSYDLTTGWPV